MPVGATSETSEPLLYTRPVRPAAEVDVDEDLVRALLGEQHPDLAGLPLRYVDTGFDNSLWRLGDTLAVRLPVRAVAALDFTAASLAAFLPIRDRYAYFGNVSGGIGWGIAAAIGVQLAQPQRKVVALLGDGSAMYSIQALWTAAHHKLPMTFVVFNNGGYRIIKQRLKLFHNTERFIGMDFVDPPIEFAALARALGVQGHRVETPAAFKTGYAEAIAASEPVLLEVMVSGSV